MFHSVTDSPVKATASDSLKMNFLYYRTSMKILWRGLLAKASIRGARFLLFLLPMALLICPTVLWAQESGWPWQFQGNLQITRNLGDDFFPSIGASPNLYLIVWTRKTPSGFDIYGAMVPKLGQSLGWNEFPICTASHDQMLPSLQWDGDNFFVVWQDRRSGKRWEIYGARVTPWGQVLDPGGILIGKGKASNDQGGPALSFDGENYLVVWQGERKNAWNIYFARVTRFGEVFDERPLQVDSARNNGISPAVVFDGNNHFVVWQDSRNNRWDIYGARISPSGEILDPEGVLISPTDKDDKTEGDKWEPAVSWDGNLFLVVWMASRGEDIWSLEAKRIDTEGRLVDPMDIQVIRNGTNKAFPAVHSNGGEHLLVWEEDPTGEPTISGESVFQTYIMPFQESDPVQISYPGMQDSSFPKIGQLGEEAIVVWQGMGPDGYWHIYGRRLKKMPEIGQGGTILE